MCAIKVGCVVVSTKSAINTINSDSQSPTCGLQQEKLYIYRKKKQHELAKWKLQQ